MITQSLNTLKGRIKIHIPENLSEITLGQMIAMQNVTGSEIPLIPELTEEVVDNIIEIDDLIQIRERVLSLAHQIKYCYTETKLPDYIVFGTRTNRWGFVKENRVKVPGNLSIEPAGAYLVSRDLIAEEINKHIELYSEEAWQENFVPSLECCCGILANYFYCKVTGNIWSEQKSEDFKSEILKLSVQEALPIARFFINAYPDLSKQKIGLWQAIKQTWKKKQVYYRLKSLNGSTQ